MLTDEADVGCSVVVVRDGGERHLVHFRHSLYFILGKKLPRRRNTRLETRRALCWCYATENAGNNHMSSTWNTIKGMRHVLTAVLDGILFIVVCKRCLETLSQTGRRKRVRILFVVAWRWNESIHKKQKEGMQVVHGKNSLSGSSIPPSVWNRPDISPNPR